MMRCTARTAVSATASCGMLNCDAAPKLATMLIQLVVRVRSHTGFAVVSIAGLQNKIGMKKIHTNRCSVFHGLIVE